VLAFVAVRGVSDILGGSDGQAVARSGAVDTRSVWPDDEARAFATRFARAYLTHSRRYPGSEQRIVASMSAPALRDTVAIERPRTQAVADTSVARVARLGADRALVTVACVVLGRSVSTRYLAVPVARDSAGGLVVFDLPSLASPPPGANVAPPEGEPLSGADAEQIEALLRRFLAAYLGGDREQLSYFMAPAAKLPVPLGGGYELIELERVERLGSRRVIAVARVHDRSSGAVYTLRYRIALARGDRWLVRGIEG
jgi:hypothetical protein